MRTKRFRSQWDYRLAREGIRRIVKVAMKEILIIMKCLGEDFRLRYKKEHGSTKLGRSGEKEHWR